MKYIIFAALFFNVQIAVACQYSRNESELKSAVEARQEMRRLTAEIAGQADKIFIGTVKELSKTEVRFEDIANLKGVTNELTKFQWVVPDVVSVGCSGVYTFWALQEPQSGEMIAYLVYAKGNRLLRINEVGSFAEPPAGYEEIEWLASGKLIQEPGTKLKAK